MAKKPNSVESRSFNITVSDQSWLVLEELAKRGVYGRNPAEVAARFVDEQLKTFVAPPRFELTGRGKPKELK